MGPRMKSNAHTSGRSFQDVSNRPKLDVLVVLGRRDSPTDGVEDYSRHLATALEHRGYSVGLMSCDWDGRGWRRSLLALRKRLVVDRPRLVLMQYTHLMWSRHGFPQMSIPVAKLMKQTGCKLGLVIHDPVNFPGPRLRDRIRHTSQYLVMRILTRIADETIVPIPLASVPWIGGQGSSRVHSIPVGSNVGHSTQRDGRSESDMFTIAVFGLTEGDKREVRNIAEIVTKVAGQVGQVRLVLLGRGSSEAKPLPVFVTRVNTS